MVVVGQLGHVDIRGTNVGKREVHAGPLDSEQIYIGEWKPKGVVWEDDPI